MREGELLGAVPELKGMLQSLEFCVSVVKVSWLFEWECGRWWGGYVCVYVHTLYVCIMNVRVYVGGCGCVL